MYPSLFVIYVLLSVAYSTAPIFVSECGTLDAPFATYQLAHDISISDDSYGLVCFNIKADGVTLDGNGFELSSASNTLLHATGVNFHGLSTTVTNMRITNLRTGIHSNGKFGQVVNNTITHAINGIDVSATNNKISNNLIGDFDANESTSGIYVYFPPIVPIDSFTNITNNVISDIRGDSFALGISVYYATSVYIANNQIQNLQGGIMNEYISVTHGSVDAHDNTFGSLPQEGYMPSATTLLLSGITLLVSIQLLRTTPGPAVHRKKQEEEEEKKKEEEEKKKEEEEKKKEEEEKKKEMEEFEKDGADEVRKPSTLSISLGSSPGMG